MGDPMDRVSLLARKLRAYRAGDGAGVHGRMTQEQLAERLDLSPETIGKYERSASYVRGDLEARLVERLGWSAADVAACRADWEAHHLRPRQSGYRLMDEAAFGSVFGSDWEAFFRVMIAVLDEEVPDVADDFAGEADLWVPIISRFPRHGGVVLKGDTFVGHWGLQFLSDVDAERFRARTLNESDLSADRLRRPLLPGLYYGYCPVVVLVKGHEAAAPLLLSSFQSFLLELTERGVLLRGIGAVSVSAGGRQFCEDLGFECLGRHLREPDYHVWELSGAQIPGSLFGRGNAVVRQAYEAAFRGAQP